MHLCQFSYLHYVKCMQDFPKHPSSQRQPQMALTGSPLGPGKPGSPSRPGVPSMPGRPGGPGKPGSPLSPFSLGEVRTSPGSPLGPGLPGAPGVPGKPWGRKKQKERKKRRYFRFSFTPWVCNNVWLMHSGQLWTNKYVLDNKLNLLFTDPPIMQDKWDTIFPTRT